jgi:hypothetical protein
MSYPVKLFRHEDRGGKSCAAFLPDQCVTIGSVAEDRTCCGALGRSYSPTRVDETSPHVSATKASPPSTQSDMLVGGRPRLAIKPMDQITETRLRNLRAAPRCGARNRAGQPCQCPAISGRRRCRLHGGLSRGAPRGTRNGNFKHGEWTKEAIEHRDWLRSLVADALLKGGTT